MGCRTHLRVVRKMPTFVQRLRRIPGYRNSLAPHCPSEAVKKALLSARAVAYSTGPSGVYIQRLFDRLGIADQMKDKSKQPAPGTRVAQYLANGEAELGFQQVSELVHEAGIDFLGPLPAEIQNVTVYSSGVPIGSNASESAKALQAFLSAPAAAPGHCCRACKARSRSSHAAAPIQPIRRCR